MAGIPTNFQSISPVIANYDFVDIASGTGYINFYAGNTVDDYLLSNFTYYSDDPIVDGGVSGTTFTLIHDLDFDVVLNRPLDLKGLAIVNVPVYFGAGNNQYPTVYVVATIRKWDGSTETDIATNTSREATASSNYSEEMFAIDINISSVTHFKIGETLRLTIQTYGKAILANPAVVDLGCDPKGRGLGQMTYTTLTFQCPVRLNL